VSTAGGEPYRLSEPDKSLGELVGELTKDFGDLVGTHIALAKVEMKDEAKRASKGAGMMVGAAIGGLLALIVLSLAAAWGLDALMPRAVAFLLVGLLWAVVAGVLALLGKKEFQELNPKPEQTVEELKEDRKWLNEQKS
jgi:uncharacterized membrane protein YqjE